MAIKIDEEMRGRIARAIDDGKTLTAAYVDDRDLPHISFFGSTHVHSEDELSLWVRNPQGSLLRVIEERPNMAFIYGDISSTVYYMFEGRGRVVSDEVERDRVYDEMHAIERQFDPDKGGVAVVVELDKVVSLSKAGRVEMTR